MPLEILEENRDVHLVREEFVSTVEDELGPSHIVLLRNFELNGATLTSAHHQVLREWVAPLSRRTAVFIEIYAMTDRSGSRALNYRMSAERLRSVQHALVANGVASQKVFHLFAKAIGEDFFEHRQRLDRSSTVFADNRKDGSLRSVLMALSPAPIGVPTRIFRHFSFAEAISFCRVHAPAA